MAAASHPETVTTTSMHNGAATKTIVAVDADPTHVGPLAWGADRAQRTGGELELIFVIERSWGEETDSPPEMLVDAAHMHLAAKREYASGRMRGTISTRWAFGSVAEQLRAVSLDADILVIGARRQPIRPAFTSSIGVRVAAVAPCTTVIVPHDWEESGTGVVVGTDGSPESELAIEFAADEAQSRAQLLTIVCAGYSANPLLTGLVPEESVGERRQWIVDAGAKAVRDRHPSIRLDARVVEGPAAPSLVHAAADARLLVLGGHARSGLERVLLGSVAHDVLVNTSVPTALVRSRA